MTDDLELTDIIVFAVPDLALGRDLVRQLEDRWECAVHKDLNAILVVGSLPPTGKLALAKLLRRVEAWVGERSLGGITFWLDGRGYVLGHVTLPESSRLREPASSV